MNDPIIYWLMAGAAMVVIEAITFPGIGLFLAGFGAISAALIIKIGLVGAENIPAQFAWCFALTTAWGILLWKPLKKFRASTDKKGKTFQHQQSDMIGSLAVVAVGGLTAGKQGQVKWSGTLMNAMLSDGIPFLPEGTQVRITAVSGTTLTVTPAS